ncbi:site-specific integrase [Variovorax ginsengisoli]|uniref:Integrase n=1 Tax=Variovorax ginsengisoli TaxID=363844 RepID=A0ABT9SFJ7_9BURK|nr:site-specific integrase [Variovorax ginsengisoli]MDP9902137.1 integrase [Variovorax ginsengisoli]
MAGAQYLYRRASGIYFVRFCVPPHLRVAVGQGEIHRTTGCSDFKLAKGICAALAVEWHQALRSVERMDIRKLKAGSLRLLGDGFIPLEDAASELGTTPAILTKGLIHIGARFAIEAHAWSVWVGEGDIRDVLDHGVDEFGRSEMVIDAARLGGQAALKPFSGRVALRYSQDAVEITQGVEPIGVCHFQLWHSQAHFVVCDAPGRQLETRHLEARKTDVEILRGRLLARITPEREREVEAARAAAESASVAVRVAGAVPAITPNPAVGSGSITVSSTSEQRFSSFARAYLARHEHVWKSDQVRRRHDQCAAFEQLMADPPMSSINRLLMRRFAIEVTKIPDERHNVRRKFGVPDADYHELLRLAELHNLPRLKATAQRRLLDGIAEIFTWAVTETLLPANPAKGLGLEAEQRSGVVKKKAHLQRDKMSDEDLAKIFSQEWWVDGRGNRTAQGRFHAYRPHYYWAPLLALYVGGRLNEIAQLYVDDVNVEGVVPYIDFNLNGADKVDSDGVDAGLTSDKSLKTISSARLVPIHSRLIELGFLDYVAALRASGHQRLFPELKFDKKKGYGKAVGSWFNERFLGIRLKMERNGMKTFHSLRHNYATALGAADVPTSDKSDLMGHARSQPLVESRYGKGAALLTMKSHIDKLEYTLPPIAPFIVEDGMDSIRDALRLKVSHRSPMRAPK